MQTKPAPSGRCAFGIAALVSSGKLHAHPSATETAKDQWDHLTSIKVWTWCPSTPSAELSSLTLKQSCSTYWSEDKRH